MTGEGSRLSRSAYNKAVECPENPGDREKRGGSQKIAQRAGENAQLLNNIS